MWYVMQVMSGREGQTVLMMERILFDGILESCFVPMRRMKKKYQGEWREITEKLFPGYVFLISCQPRLLYDELKNVPALTKMLGSCEEYFTPLSEEDVRLLGRLQDAQKMQNGQETLRGVSQDGQGRCGKKEWNKNREKMLRGDGLGGMEEDGACWDEDEERTGMSEVGLSQVVVGEDRQVRIVSGPLKNLEGQIQKINLHKRIAVVEAEFMGNQTLIHLGIEIVGERL